MKKYELLATAFHPHRNPGDSVGFATDADLSEHIHAASKSHEAERLHNALHGTIGGIFSLSQTLYCRRIA